MTLLHDLFQTRNIQGFQRLLDASADRKQSANTAGSSTSGGKSWNRPRTLASYLPTVDVNARDRFGRTALHLASSSIECTEYVRALLKHPNINVNFPDTESHWTALHRAVYNANIPTALLLLQCSDIDTSVKDSEGYTAFDLYNSTVNGTKPNAGDLNAELFTWGANRNAALGLGDADDRTHPDQVVVQSKGEPEDLEETSLAVRFSPIQVRQVQMSRLHTAVVTSESAGNLRVCGFSSGGRLGPGHHTQYSLKPLPQFTHTIVSVALGQDHTIALTKMGEVLSWGLNRFSQLGYIVETMAGRHDEPIQTTPKKVHGPLRKEVVCGIAASKAASACWTADEVYTWGTNNGQLGYDKITQPVQVLPRKVTKFTHPVIAMSLTDTTMACILRTQQVECIWNDRHYHINFPVHSFPSEIQPYRPPQAIKDSHITTITACDDVFAALSSNGEVFTFIPPSANLDHANIEGGTPGRESIRAAFKPQRVWALRKKFSAVKDVALGSDGSIVICTESGHVYVRTRTGKASGKTFKFQRIPYIQRVIQVCANSAGAFGALCIDYMPKRILVNGNSIAEDLARIEPFLFPFGTEDAKGVYLRDAGSNFSSPSEVTSNTTSPADLYADDEPEDIGIEKDIIGLRRLISVLNRERQKLRQAGGSIKYDGMRLPQGADTLVHIAGLAFPVHRVILAARSTVLRSLFVGSKHPVVDQYYNPNIEIRLMPSRPGPGLGVLKLNMIAFKGVQPLSVLVFLHYLYSDELYAMWDRRVHTALSVQAVTTKVNVAIVRTDLQALAHLLELPLLTQALEPPVKRLLAPSIIKDLRNLFSDSQTLPQGTSPLSPDVLLEFADEQAWTHSAVLRGRSDFFASLFGEDVWTLKRWGADGILRIDFKHLHWRVMEYVLRFVVCGEDADMFETLSFAKSIDDVLEFMFDVIAAANELLLDRLILLCSNIILTYLNIYNACYILSEATHYHALQLTENVQSYMVANMESLLESRMLDELPYVLVKQLSAFIRGKQMEKSPFSRDNVYIEALTAKYADWVALQDFPEPIVRSHKALSSSKDVSKIKLSPPTPIKGSVKAPILQTTPPLHQSIRRPPSGDDLFAMDEVDPSSVVAGPLVPSSDLPAPHNSPVWKMASNPRVDMKAVMAETKSSRSTSSLAQPNASNYTPKVSQVDVWKSNVSSLPSKALPRPAGSPWKVPREAHTAAPHPLLSSSSTPPSQTGGLSKSRPHVPVPSHHPHIAQASSSPGLGPVITPTRLPVPNSGNSSRNVSSAKAWALPHPQPVVTMSCPTSGVSFLAIQHSQQEQPVDSIKDKRSLLEIQEEEQAHQAESDFLKWWEAEADRVKQEVAALEEYRRNISNPPRRPPRQKGKSVHKAKSNVDGPADANKSGFAASSNHEGSLLRKPKRRKPSQNGNPADLQTSLG